MMDREKSWAIITGASSGLGVELAKELAARQSNLVLVARRRDPMEALAARLRAEFAIEVLVEPSDLGEPNAAKHLFDSLNAQHIDVRVLVNNAGFGLQGHFLDHDANHLRQMLQLDIIALTELTQLFAHQMREKGGGHVLLVASMAAYQPNPLYAAYGAAKAYVLSLGEALSVELAPLVNVTVLSPGLMETGFTAVAGHKITASQRWLLLSPPNVAKLGVQAMFNRRPSVVAGIINRLSIFLSRFFPRRLQAQMIFRMMKDSSFDGSTTRD